MVRLRRGSTSSQAAAPRRHRPAATRNDTVQPKWAAIQGVSEAVTAPPICAPVFMKPETEPDELAGDVCSHRPERTLREIESSRTAGQHHAGHSRALDLRAKDQKYSGAEHDDSSQHAAADPRPVRFG